MGITLGYRVLLINISTSLIKIVSSFKQEKIKRISYDTIKKLIVFFPKITLWDKMNKIIFNRPLNFKDLFVLKSHTIGK